MKRIIAIASLGLFTLSAAVAAEPSQADQKWLTAVEQKVAKGDKVVSTPNKDRVNLLKKWADEKGYTLVVTKTGENYRVELSKSLARN
jgi:hypothetical protein